MTYGTFSYNVNTELTFCYIHRKPHGWMLSSCDSYLQIIDALIWQVNCVYLLKSYAETKYELHK